LVGALGLGDAVSQLERELSVSFVDDPGLQFIHRQRLFPLVEAALRLLKFSELPALFNPNGVCWGPYQSLKTALERDPRYGAANPILQPVNHVSGQRYLTPGAAATLAGMERGPATRAPRLGEHTDEILAGVLGLSEAEICGLHDREVVANPTESHPLP